MGFSRFLRNAFYEGDPISAGAQVDFEERDADPSRYTIGHNIHPASEFENQAGADDGISSPYDGAMVPGGAPGMGGMGGMDGMGGMPDQAGMPGADQLQPIEPGMQQPGQQPGQPPMQESVMDDFDLFLEDLLDETIDGLREGPYDFTANDLNRQQLARGPIGGGGPVPASMTAPRNYAGFAGPQAPPASISSQGPAAVQQWQQQMNSVRGGANGGAGGGDAGPTRRGPARAPTAPGAGSSAPTQQRRDLTRLSVPGAGGDEAFSRQRMSAQDAGGPSSIPSNVSQSIPPKPGSGGISMMVPPPPRMGAASSGPPSISQSIPPKPGSGGISMMTPPPPRLGPGSPAMATAPIPPRTSPQQQNPAELQSIKQPTPQAQPPAANPAANKPSDDANAGLAVMSSKDWGLNWADYNILHESDRREQKRKRGY